VGEALEAGLVLWRYDAKSPAGPRVSQCWDNGLAIMRAKYISAKEMFMPQPSIRLIVTAKHSDEVTEWNGME
jgi:hypothetical protein